LICEEKDAALKNVIIGTAGHVDHGKTEIVKALTGRDTDRLSEEKSRGISIVLGFAPLDIGEGFRVGIVDVPGHEKFVKNMVSGAVGVDLFILVIAADEGVMPQTLEHFEVLRLLGVSSGVVAVSKTDLVQSDLAEVVESEVRDLLDGTSLEGAPVVRVSSVTGEGMERLKRILAELCRKASLKKESGIFRIPVDRVFSKAGIGTIITGTTWSGKVAVSDELVLEPSGRRLRVREIQSFDRSLQESESGMRIALALHGVKKGDISIGDQLLTPDRLVKTGMLDVFVEVSSLPGSAISSRQRLRFHHAAGEIMCRAVPIGREKLERGRSGYLQLRLEKPTVAMAGDMFVLRAYSPMRVIGGGRVLDPAPAKMKKRDKGREEQLRILNEAGPERRLESLVERSGCKGMLPLELVKYGFGEAYLDEVTGRLVDEGRLIRAGKVLVGAGIASAKEKQMLELLNRFISNNRLIWGMEREELRARLGLENSPLFDYIIDKGNRDGTLFLKKGSVRSGSEERELSHDERSSLEKVEKMIRDSGFEFSEEEKIARKLGDVRKTSRYLHILQERGAVTRIKEGCYLHSESMNRILSGVESALNREGELTIGRFKEDFGFSRKFAVPVLEYLDSRGYTRREGNVRLPGPQLEEGEKK